MDKTAVISAKLSDEIYTELILRIPEGERSNFVRDAIKEKLQHIPRPDKIIELEKRLGSIETTIAEIKRYLTELEVLTLEKGKVNPHVFCVDETDHKIMDFLLHYKGATTSELAACLKTNRWHVLNRLRKIQKMSNMQLGKSIIAYYPADRQGKKKAWWLAREIIEF